MTKYDCGATGKTAYCGIICALAISLMYLSIIPAAEYIVPAVSGLLLWTVLGRAGAKRALMCYAACALLVLFMIPEPQAAWFFVGFFGWYPIAADYFARIKRKLPRVMVKFAAFNASCLPIFRLLTAILGIDRLMDGSEFLGEYALPGMWVIANVSFLLYDLCVLQLKIGYNRFIAPILNKRL